MNMTFYDKAASYLAKHEGFRENAYYDVNAYRIGYGSSTLTLPDGSNRKVVKGDKTTKELALKDLNRRISKEFEPRVIKQVGSMEYNRLPDEGKIALISIAYNYGSITKKDIIDAAKSGDLQRLSEAIVDSTKNDNLGKPYYESLRKRRQDEANLVSSAIQKVVETAKQAVETTKETARNVKNNPLPFFLLSIGFISIIYAIKQQVKWF